MKEFFTVLGYTFKENSRKKTFIISTIITLILTIIVMSLPAIMKSFDNDDKNKTEKQGIIFVIDSKGILKGDLNKLSKTIPGYQFKSEQSLNIGDLKERVTKEKDTAIIVIDEKAGIPTFDYLVKNAGSGLEPNVIGQALKSIFVWDLLKSASVSDNISAMALSDVSYNINELGKGMKSYIASIVISMVLFLSIFFYGNAVAMSIASEKTSRVMELLVTSTKPSKIVLGKSVAMGLLGLIQLLLLVTTATITYKLNFPKDFKLDGLQIDLSSFTPFTILMIILYFILGYALYAMMNAVAGATVSKAEDVNSAIMPISMISIIAFYFAYIPLILPEGNNIAIVASIIPFSAAFSMPCRLLSTSVPAWQLMASIVSMVITIIFTAWISIKIYSSAVLHYGKRLKVKDLLRMSNRSA